MTSTIQAVLWQIRKDYGCTKKQAAFILGQKEYGLGHPEEDNPFDYIKEEALYHEWTNGFEDAMHKHVESFDEEAIEPGL